MWKPERPLNTDIVCWKLRTKNNSTQLGCLGFLKHAPPLTRFFESCWLRKVSRRKVSVWNQLLLDGEWYVPRKGHLFFSKICSINILRYYPRNYALYKRYMECHFDQYQNTITISISISLKGLENPSVRNLDDGKISSNSVYVRDRIPIWFIIKSFNWSNLPGREFIFKRISMILFALFDLSLLNSHSIYHYFARFLMDFHCSCTSPL